jgi:hypothetical protein
MADAWLRTILAKFTLRRSRRHAFAVRYKPPLNRRPVTKRKSQQSSQDPRRWRWSVLLWERIDRLASACMRNAAISKVSSIQLLIPLASDVGLISLKCKRPTSQAAISTSQLREIDQVLQLGLLIHPLGLYVCWFFVTVKVCRQSIECLAPWPTQVDRTRKKSRNEWNWIQWPLESTFDSWVLYRVSRWWCRPLKVVWRRYLPPGSSFAIAWPGHAKDISTWVSLQCTAEYIMRNLTPSSNFTGAENQTDYLAFSISPSLSPSPSPSKVHNRSLE